jgi:hypothetical protein
MGAGAMHPKKGGYPQEWLRYGKISAYLGYPFCNEWGAEGDAAQKDGYPKEWLRYGKISAYLGYPFFATNILLHISWICAIVDNQLKLN